MKRRRFNKPTVSTPALTPGPEGARPVWDLLGTGPCRAQLQRSWDASKRSRAAKAAARRLDDVLGPVGAEDD